MSSNIKALMIVACVVIFVAVYFFVGVRVAKSVNQTSTTYHQKIQQIQ